MFSMTVTGTPPAGWLICDGAEVEHADDVTECSHGAACLGLDELHATTRACTSADRGSLTHRCRACAG